jgi:RND family efflux transporter MFP subunit
MLPAIPVTVAKVKTGDFPVYLNGLGTVEPFVTVTVRSRLDGEVTKVTFKQGQMVKEGDLLVQIDPRPYQAALDQALAKKAQDEANLANAQVDLQRYTTLAKKDSIARQRQQKVIRRRLMTPRHSSAIRPSGLRSREKWAFASSIRATSFTQLTRRAL